MFTNPITRTSAQLGSCLGVNKVYPEATKTLDLMFFSMDQGHIFVGGGGPFPMGAESLQDYDYLLTFSFSFQLGSLKLLKFLSKSNLKAFTKIASPKDTAK